MKIEIKNLELINFKGIKNLQLEFASGKTNIFGENASGKTTVFDAFIWLLFGKDSQDRKDFEIKTLDSDNKTIHKLEHEVNGVFAVDGNDTHLRRVYREKWVKKRGTTEPELIGHETLFYVDDVPYQAKDYKDKINSIIDEDIFKLITNVHYFNNLHWKKQRQILLSIAGDLSDEEVAKGKKEFEELLTQMQGKSMEEYRRMIKEKIKRLKNDLDDIPVRIDEITRNIPEEPDYDLINKSIEEKKSRLEQIDQALMDKSKEYSILIEKKEQHYKKISDLKINIAAIESEAKLKANSQNNNIELKIAQKENEKKEKERVLSNTMTVKEHIKKEILDAQMRINALRDKWHEVNAEILVFDDNEFVCPTCQRSLDEALIANKKAQMEINFNENKILRIKKISQEGKQLNASIEKALMQLNELDINIDKLNQEINGINAEIFKLKDITVEKFSVEDFLKNHKKYGTIKSELVSLQEQQLEAIVVDDQSLRSEQQLLRTELDQLKSKLAIKDMIQSSRDRIEELKKMMSKTAQQIAEYEKIDFAIEAFIVFKIDRLEESLNKMFKIIRFKLFEHQLNGGTNETCEVLIDGVPYSDANNAAKVQAGVEIINVLSNYYHVSAPVFVDNSESINAVPEIKSQLILLTVIPEMPQEARQKESYIKMYSQRGILLTKNVA